MDGGETMLMALTGRTRNGNLTTSEVDPQNENGVERISLISAMEIQKTMLVFLYVSVVAKRTMPENNG